MNKINILLIDDNPRFCFHLLEDGIAWDCVPDNNFSAGQHKLKIPLITNDYDGPERERWAGLAKYFQLGWLQSPLDVKEFCNLSSEIERRSGTLKLGEAGFVPDIICFDYALSEMMDVSYYDPVLDKPVLHLVNPNYRMAEFLNTEFGEKNELYRHLNNIPRNYKTHEQSSLDNMGCYAGGVTAFLFRNHPCASIPVTFKTKDSVEGEDAGYFEWLVESEMEDAFNWDDRGEDKAWYRIISDAIGRLRKRIEKQIYAGKVTPVHKELWALANTGTATLKEDSILTIHTVYGTKQFPLHGLFIDIEPEERVVFIADWATGIIKSLYTREQYVLTETIIDRAKQFSEKLWSHYSDTEKVLKRLKLSEVGYLLKMSDEELARELNLPDEKTLDTTLIELNSTFKTLAEEFGLAGNYVTNSYDIRSEDYSCLERRWAALLTMLKLHHHYLNYSLSPDPSLPRKLNVSSEPQENDYYLALFPIPSTPLVTKFHKTADGENFKKTLKRQTSLIEDTDTGKEGLQLEGILKRRMPGGLLKEEIILLRTFANNVTEFPLYINNANLPIWVNM